MKIMNDLAKEYAFALFQLAKEKDTLSETALCLKDAEKILRENDAYRTVLQCPAIPMEERLSLLDASFGSLPVPEVTNLFKLLCEKSHFSRVYDCMQAFFALWDEACGRIPVTVYYAAPLSDAQKEALRNKLRSMTEKEPELSFVEKPDLIGGIRVQVGDRVADGTLSGKLDLMKGVLNREQPC